MVHASQMTAEQISDSMLAGLKKLRDEGKDLANNWDVMWLSFPGIQGGEYNPSYGHGGPESVHETVLRMSRCGSSKIHAPALRKIIEAMKMTLARSEFTEDPMLFLAKNNIDSYFPHLELIADSFKKMQRK